MGVEMAVFVPGVLGLLGCLGELDGYAVAIWAAK